MWRWWKFVSWVLFLGLLVVLVIHGFKGPLPYESKRILSATYKPFFFQPPAVKEPHDPTTGAAVPPRQRTYHKRPRDVALSPHHRFHPLPDPPVVGPVIAPTPSHPHVAFPPDRQRNHGSPCYSKGPTSSAAQTSSSFKGKPWSSLPQPVQPSPPPPPNVGCMPLTCTNPLTNSPPGSPCACVLPIRVGLQLDVAPYTFFPLVSQLSQELAAGVFMDQNQVRVMGANAPNEEPDRTIIFINLVPYGIQFDNTTAFLIYKKFWNKEIFIKDPIFRDYDVLYVLYPGLPPSPPMAAGSFGTDSNGRTINPLAVDVREPKEKHHKELKTLVILSSATALVLFIGALLFLLLKCRYYQRVVAPVLQNSLNSLGSGSTISKLKPFSDSATLNSSIIPHVGLAKTFNITEIEKATNKFDASRIIGEGGFGRVYEGTLVDGTSVAVKVLKRYDQHGNREFLAEVEMLCRLHHRNLVKLVGICTEDYIQCLIYELVPNGSVEFHLHGTQRKSTPLGWNARMKIALGAARCLAYLHEDSNPCVIHRDFKSSNVLLEHDFTPRVSDLGLARIALNGGNEHISTHVVGTFGYVAPEYAMTGHLLVKSDVYSYGVVLLELLTGRKPVDIMRPPGQENLVTWTRPLLASKESLETILDPSLGTDVPFDSIAKVAAVASMCVEAEFSQRPSMGEVVQALKLVYHESNDHIGSGCCSHEELTVFQSEARAASGLGFQARSVSPATFNNSSRFIGDASCSFRRHSSSGPLRTGGTWKFWPWFKTSSAGSVSEHGIATGYSRGMESNEFWL